MEFLIKRTDGEWFDLRKDRFNEILRPTSMLSKTIQGWGDHRIEVLGCAVAFSYEDVGIQVSFEGKDIPETRAEEIVEEICRNIEEATHQRGRVMRIE